MSSKTISKEGKVKRERKDTGKAEICQKHLTVEWGGGDEE